MQVAQEAKVDTSKSRSFPGTVEGSIWCHQRDAFTNNCTSRYHGMRSGEWKERDPKVCRQPLSYSTSSFGCRTAALHAHALVSGWFHRRIQLQITLLLERAVDLLAALLWGHKVGLFNPLNLEYLNVVMFGLTTFHRSNLMNQRRWFTSLMV